MYRYARLHSPEHMQPHHLFLAFIVQPVAVWKDLRLKVERCTEVRLLTDGLSEESRRSDADDDERRTAQLQLLAEHVGTSVETSTPVRMAENDDRLKQPVETRDR